MEVSPCEFKAENLFPLGQEEVEMRLKPWKEGVDVEGDLGVKATAMVFGLDTF